QPTCCLPICRTRANPIPPNLVTIAGLTLAPPFPCLHQLHTVVPFRNNPLRVQLALSLPKQSSAPTFTAPPQSPTHHPPLVSPPSQNSSPIPPIHFFHPSH